MVAVRDGEQRIVVSYLRIGIAVGEERTGSIDVTNEGCGVFARLSEVESGKLQHCGEVFYRGGSGNGLGFVADGGGHTHSFRGK